MVRTAPTIAYGAYSTIAKSPVVAKTRPATVIEQHRRPPGDPEWSLDGGSPGVNGSGGHLIPNSWRSADRAARWPDIPWTPPPGGVEDEHMYSPRVGVR